MISASAPSSVRAAQLFHALADGIRLDVIELLQGGERCVCELMAELDLAQSRLSWHLKTLADAGLVNARREGRWNYYSLRPEALDEAQEYLEGARAPARRSPRKVACCD
ncbi:MAG: ArsR/SmtB family transcription factor [Gemmatimonadaceae bacterium]